MRIRTPLIMLIIAVAAFPLAAWAAFKPIRVVAPELLGLYCNDDGICIDDQSRLPEATALKAEATSFVNAKIGRIEKVPRVVFCSGTACAKSFGFTDQAAYHVGTSGIVIGPRGWHPYIVRHELIHHLQMEHIGSVHALLFTPTWFIEGMAYSLSEDPRRPLPEPLEAWRTKFERWNPGVEHQDVWSAAEAL